MEKTIAIATGINELDLAIQQSMEESQIVNYREFFLTTRFKTVILSRKLKGDMALEQLVFYLKKNGTKIVYLLGENDTEDIKMCFKYSVYDMVFDEITVEKVLNAVKTTKNLKDWSKLFVEVMNGEEITEKKVTLKDMLFKGKKDSNGSHIDDGKNTKVENNETENKEEDQQDYEAKKKAEIELKKMQQLREEEKQKFEKDIEELKKKLEKEKQKGPEIIEKIRERTIKQNVLAVYTTDNSRLRDEILTQISYLLAKKSRQNILVLDFNSFTPTLDYYFGINKEIDMYDIYLVNKNNNTGLSAAYNAIEKNIFTSELLENLVVRHKKYSNLSILTGLYDINLFDSINAKHYEKIIDVAKEVYDTIIINTSPDIAIDATYVSLKKSTNILLISEADYAYSRNINAIVNYLSEYQKIPLSKFKAIIANINQYSLSKDVMDKVFSGIEIISYIKHNPKSQYYINRKKPYILSTAAKNDLMSYYKILEHYGYVPKVNVINKLFGEKRKLQNEICTGSEVDVK